MRKTNFFISQALIFSGFGILINFGCHYPTEVSTSVDKIFYNTSSVVQDSFGVYSMNPDGSNQNLVYKGGRITSPPRGSNILVTKTKPDSTLFIMIDIFGNNEKLLFTQYGYYGYAILSPNGKYIAYGAYGTVGTHKIRNLDTKIDITFGDSTKGYLLDIPVFSPDSKQLLYGQYQGSSSIFAVNVNGTGNKLISSNIKDNNQSTYFLQCFDWSPDGKKVCSIQILGQNFVLNIFDLQSSTSSIFQIDSLTFSSIKWSPLGKYILLNTWRLSYNGEGVNALPIIYDVSKNEIKKFPISDQLDISDFLDYEWSPDEKEVLLLMNERTFLSSYKFSTLSLNLSSGISTDIHVNSIIWGQFYWSRNKGE